MKSFKRPQQGTAQIQSAAKKEMGQRWAEKHMAEVVSCFEIKDDPDFEILTASLDPDPEAWKRLVAKYGKQNTANAWKVWRYGEK